MAKILDLGATFVFQTKLRDYSKLNTREGFLTYSIGCFVEVFIHNIYIYISDKGSSLVGIETEAT